MNVEEEIRNKLLLLLLLFDVDAGWRQRYRRVGRIVVGVRGVCKSACALVCVCVRLCTGGRRRAIGRKEAGEREDRRRRDEIGQKNQKFHAPPLFLVYFQYQYPLVSLESCSPSWALLGWQPNC